MKFMCGFGREVRSLRRSKPSGMIEREFWVMGNMGVQDGEEENAA